MLWLLSVMFVLFLILFVRRFRVCFAVRVCRAVFSCSFLFVSLFVVVFCVGVCVICVRVMCGLWLCCCVCMFTISCVCLVDVFVRILHIRVPGSLFLIIGCVPARAKPQTLNHAPSANLIDCAPTQAPRRPCPPFVVVELVFCLVCLRLLFMFHVLCSIRICCRVVILLVSVPCLCVCSRAL